MTFTSDIISITPGVYIRHVMSRWTGRWWWALAIPFAGFLFAARWHTAFLFVALIWLFLIVPPLIMMIYIVYGMRPGVQNFLRPHRVTITDSTITLTFTSIDGYADLPPSEISCSSVSSVHVSRSAVVIYLSGGFHDIIVLPLSEIPDENRAELLKRFLVQ